MPDANAITISVTLYPQEIAALERWSEEEGRSKSNMVRRLVKQELERRSERTPEAA